MANMERAHQDGDHHLFLGVLPVPCICVSVLFILLTMFLAEAVRKVATAALPRPNLLRTAILEFAAAAEMCGCGFELIIGRRQRKFTPAWRILHLIFI